MKKGLTVSFIFVAAVLFLNVRVLACSCGQKPTVLDQFEGAEIVVTTRLVSVDKIGEKEREYDVHHIRSVTMIVGKVYKGNVKPGQVLKFAQGGGADCIWTFDEEDAEREYLFYLGKPTKGHPFRQDENSSTDEPMYRAVTCGRSNSLRGAADDLAYLDNINKLKGKTRLSGRFDSWYTEEPIGAGLKVKIIGKSKTYQAKTDKNGFFEIYDLPPGDYDAVPELPFGWKLNDYMLGQTFTGFDRFPQEPLKEKNRIPVRITEKRHTALDLYFDIDTAIKGRVLSPAGKPMKGVCVKAVSTELKEGDYRGQSDCTDEKGEFLIDEMARGNYVLVVNDDGKMDGDEPFGVMFYPGVSELKNAGIVRVEPGKYVTGLDIQISQTVELIELRGKFVFSDGKPVAGAWIKFSPADEKRFDSVNARSDDAGNFAFKLPKGAVGQLFGEMHTYVGEFVKCPKFDSLIKETGQTYHTFKTGVVGFDGATPDDQIEIALPFPYCAKAKE